MRNILILFMLCGLAGLGGCAVTPSEPAEGETENPALTVIRKLIPESQTKRRQKLMNHLASPYADKRREGVRMLGEKEPSQWEVTPRILSIMAQGDPNPQVRAAAIGVLGELDQTEVLITTLTATAKDESPQVRQETLRMLAKQNNAETAAILLERLQQDSDPSLRSEAARQLARFPQDTVIQALIAALSDEEFAVIYEARRSLATITGEDYGYNAGEWRNYVKTRSAAAP